MGIPGWFRLADVSASIAESFSRTEKLRAGHLFEPMQIARLDRTAPSADLRFQHDSVRDVRPGEDLLRTTESWEGFAVSWYVRTIRAFVYLQYWRMNGGTGLGVEIDDQVPYVEPAGMAQGEWIERFMCDYVSLCRSDVCVNGFDWPCSYSRLDSRMLLSQWREQGLPRMPSRGFYMLSEQVVEADELELLMARLSDQERKWLRHFKTQTGYHVFSTLSRRKWWES